MSSNAGRVGGLTLALANSSITASIEGGSLREQKLLSLLRDLKGSGHWVFLQTHGMWAHNTSGDLSAVIYPGGETELYLVHSDYPLIKALEGVPLFHFMVDRLVVYKAAGQASGVSPWGIHIRVKRGELASMPSSGVKVSPLTFFGATIGLHRVALSFRIQAVQSALSRKIAKALFGSCAEVSSFHELYGVCEQDETRGSLAAFASGMAKASRIPREALEAELTTSVIPVRDPKNYSELLEALLREDSLRLDVDGSQQGMLRLVSDNGALNEPLEKVSGDILSRLVAYKRASDELGRKVNSNTTINLAVGFSEQMGPCDLYLLSCLIKKLRLKAKKTYVLATPLSYPMATLASLYASLSLNTLGHVELVITSEDVESSKLLAGYLAGNSKSGTEEETLVYLASGPTSQVLTLSLMLKRLKREKTVLVPLVPPLKG
jgi:hypothetical protein